MKVVPPFVLYATATESKPVPVRREANESSMLSKPSVDNDVVILLPLFATSRTTNEAPETLPVHAFTVEPAKFSVSPKVWVILPSPVVRAAVGKGDVHFDPAVVPDPALKSQQWMVVCPIKDMLVANPRAMLQIFFITISIVFLKKVFKRQGYFVREHLLISNEFSCFCAFVSLYKPFSQKCLNKKATVSLVILQCKYLQ